MKLFVLALLALSCVQMVIAKYKKTPFQTNEQVIKTQQVPEGDPLRHLSAALPPTFSSGNHTPVYGVLYEVPNHPKLVAFFPDRYKSKLTPGNPDDIPFIYFRVRWPDPPVPNGRIGRLIPVYTREGGGGEQAQFIPLLDSQPPSSKKGSGGSGSKKNEPERLSVDKGVLLKAAVPPLPGLEAQADGQDGNLTPLSDGAYSFKPKLLGQKLQNGGPNPIFYLRTYFPQDSDGSTLSGRLYYLGSDEYKFETFKDHYKLGMPKRIADPPGKKRSTYSYGNEALMRGLPNTYWNPASRFL